MTAVADVADARRWARIDDRGFDFAKLPQSIGVGSISLMYDLETNTDSQYKKATQPRKTELTGVFISLS